MKKSFKKIFMTSLVLSGLFVANIPSGYVFAEESKEVLAIKTDDRDFSELSDEEKAFVGELEAYLKENMNLNQRGFVADTAVNAVLDLIFQIGFVRDCPLFEIVYKFADGNYDAEIALGNQWYESLPNSVELNMAVKDETTGKDIRLFAHYVDNQASKTVIIHNGYRSEPAYILAALAQTHMFEEEYNILIPDVRGHGRSGGDYLTFGYYEKQDLNQWIDLEVSRKPGQEIILYGLSMGGATVVMSQDTPHPNVVAIIEDCGYYSLDQQLQDVAGLLTSYLKYIPLVNSVDWDGKVEYLVSLLNERKIKPILKFDLYDVMPVESVKKNELPKLFIHGGADSFIPPVAKEILYENAAGYKEELTVPGAQHAQSYKVDEATYKAKIYDFLDVVFAEKENPEEDEAIEVYALNNPHTNASFYTSNLGEKDFLASLGWRLAEEPFSTPASGDAVYRIYNPNAGQHHYTRSGGEKSALVKIGWIDEGVAFYSNSEEGMAFRRLYKNGVHFYTSDEKEYGNLLETGAVEEGIAWYGL